jgi:hypothetical protein
MSGVLTGDAFTVNIPAPGTPLFDMRTTLNGVEYVLLFDWHDRESRWYMSVFDVSGNTITAGIKLLANWPLYSRETLPQAPHGQFIVSDPEGLPAQLADFGLRTVFQFWPAE